MKVPATLTHNGKAHRCLARLSEDAATFSELIGIACVFGPNQTRKLDILLSILIREGYLIRRGEWFNITDLGEEALACLNRGTDFTVGEWDTVPSVRVFGRAAA